MSNKRYRNYCFTLNNYTEDDIHMLKGSDLFTYIIFGEEVAPTTGTPHLQGYFEMAEAKTISSLIKKHVPKGIHLEPAKGNQKQNKEYCSKGKNIFEKGSEKKQGARNDLDALRNQIENGTSVDDICMDNPMIFHLYGRTMERIEAITLRKKWRTWMTTCDWYYGPTGVGKSHQAFLNFDPEKCYVFNLNDNGWWDGYKGQETVIINEFRGNIPYGELLDLIDKNAKYVKWRCREKVPFLAKHIIITSSLRPEDCYHNLAVSDSLEQLFRRINLLWKKKQEDIWVPMNGVRAEEEDEYYDLYQEFKGEV